ncbi:DUF7409 domain-containing protein [Halorarum salinum]|uniref:DUF7409 domain-containing protein n=1 Tax=Halorarum salinum TaxID=2743089 RepID=A0A7D5QG39_9EURY|nr:hypothetical protein [Halobaculum salinum]QLG61802.1 hypothetical protein HUG12_08720 [Halobaculum salinum]
MTEEAPDPTDIKYVGPATAAVLADATFDAAGIREKTVSFRMLLDADVNPGVAARIRREHSLSWSFESEDADDLRRRSSQVRGLGDAERAWVAAASDDWSERELTPAEEADDGEEAWVAASSRTTAEAAEADGSGDPVAAESAWRDRSRPTPLTALDGVDEGTVGDLAEAGITSVRSLSTADPSEVADALDRDVDRVADLRDAANEYLG